MKTFIKKIDMTTLGGYQLVPSVGAGKRLILYALFATCGLSNADTYGHIYLATAGEARKVAQLIARKGRQILHDPHNPPHEASVENYGLRLSVESITGNGFADSLTWVYGMYGVKG